VIEMTEMKELSYVDAIIEGIAEEMVVDPKIFHMSTEAPRRLQEEFGFPRVRQTPIAESALTGMAIGAAAGGYRPIVDWRLVTFCFVAMDQIVNQAAKIHYMFGGQTRFPLVFRTTVGGGTRRAAQHSQSPYSMFMQLTGLKLVLPSTPADAKGLIKTAIRDDNPVVFFEAGRLGGVKGPIPNGDVSIPFGKADVKREGKDVTVVALAWMVHEALAAAEELSKQGIEVEVIDPRTLVPLDIETIRRSVFKTGRLVIADEAPAAASVSADIAARIVEDAASFEALKAPISRVTGLDAPIPYSPSLEDYVFPDRFRIIEAIRRIL
jgi:pyruvate/2-oxoglutarate/acetoin dehydrogenase E1 component